VTYLKAQKNPTGQYLSSGAVQSNFYFMLSNFKCDSLSFGLI